MAPWRCERTQQRTLACRVAVTEQRTPGFALRFDLELPGEVSLMRLVSQRQMLQTFEFAFVGAEAEMRRPPGGEDAALDRKLKTWLAGGGQVQAPPKEELARWLLAWMVVAPATDADGDKQPDEWLVLLCGETGAEEEEEDFSRESGDAGEPVCDDEKEEGDCDDGSGGETEDELPPYQEVEDVTCRSSELSDEEDARVLNEKSEVRPVESTRSSRSGRVLPFEDQPVMKQAKRGSTIRSSSSRSLGSALTSSTAKEQKDKSELKPTIVRLNPRLDSLEAVRPEEPSKLWSDDRRHFQQELCASRQDVLAAKHQRDKVERLAQVRHTQLLKASARKLRVNEQKRRDALAVRQIIADTLEYRDELCAMESRVKQASIAAHRDQERVRLQTRVVLGNTEKILRGAVKLGPGPLSMKEMALINGDARDESAVYDLHGRRHNLQDAAQVAKESALESAMRKIRRLLLNSGDSVEIFRRYDRDRSGALSYKEFQRVLQENGTELTQEQSSTFFNHFDSDDSGEVDYCELLWGFFNWEAFLKKWHERKSVVRTDREVRQSFERYDPTSRGVLTINEFQLMLDYLGVTLSDVDAKLLGVKFEAGKNDYIDYHKFLGSVNEPGFSSAKHSSRPTAPGFHNSAATATADHIWKEIQDLTATQARLHALLRKQC